MHNSSWDDLRYVLTVADMGSVNRAARHLGVNHATVLRHIADYEARHGAEIFERSARGYRVLADKQDVINAARAAAEAVELAGHRASGSAIGAGGKLRITSTDTLGQSLLPEVLAEIGARQKNLTFEILCSNAHVDLARLNIDITVRPAPKLPEGLEGQAVANLGFAAYASSRTPRGWLGLAGPLARSVAADWMAQHVKPDEITGASDSFLILSRLAALGKARAILPCLIGDMIPGLVRLQRDMPPLTVPLWVASPKEAVAQPRVKSALADIGQAIAARADQLSAALPSP